MSSEVMVAKAKALVDDGDVEYVNTNANTHIFSAKGHDVRVGSEYVILAEIQQNNEIEWTCTCDYKKNPQFNGECKHTIACRMLMKDKELRDEYKALSIDIDKHYHDDDEAVEVIGMRAFKVESDDD